MLRRLIIAVRNKPKHVRDNYALGLAAGLTAIIVTVWAFNWPGTNQDEVAETGSTPFSTFFDEAKDQLGAAKESIEAAVPAQSEEETASTASLESDNPVQNAINRATTTNRPSTTSAPARLVPVSATTSTTTI